MDKDTAQDHLDAWEAADLATAGGKQYSIGNRALTRADAEEIRNQITYWNGKVKFHAAREAGMRNPGVAVAVWS
jgi:hypothetical protein